MRNYQTAEAAVQLGQHALHPCGPSSSGHHIVKFIINGIPRSVEIDDRLPYDNTGKALHAVARVAGDDAPWVGLLEKAVRPKAQTRGQPR